jgi:hypothetical protein
MYKFILERDVYADRCLFPLKKGHHRLTVADALNLLLNR